MPACSSCGSESAELMQIEGAALCAACVNKSLADLEPRFFDDSITQLPSYDYLDGKKYFGFAKVVKGRERTCLITEDGTLLFDRLDLDERGKMRNFGIPHGERFIRFSCPPERPLPFDTNMSNHSLHLLQSCRRSGIPIEGKALFQELKDWLRQYVYFQHPGEYALCVAWAFHTYFYYSMGATPYLMLQGIQASGKTTMLKWLASLSFKGHLITDVQPAFIYRIGEANQPSACFDELDKMNEETRRVATAAFNHGYQRGAYIPRNDRAGFRTSYYNAFYPKAFACNDFAVISSFRSRCIQLNMVRANPDPPKNINYQTPEDRSTFQDQLDRLYVLGLTGEKELRAVFEALNAKELNAEWLSSRDFEIIRPLLAVLRLWGGERDFENALAFYEEERDYMREQGDMPSRDMALLSVIYSHLYDSESKTPRITKKAFRAIRTEERQDNEEVALVSELEGKLTLGEDEGKFKPSGRSVGKMLSRLGLNKCKKREPYGRVYWIGYEDWKEAASRWGVANEFS
jgi:hypothetical protein